MGDILIISKSALKQQADIYLTDDPSLSVDAAYGLAIAHLAAMQSEQEAFDDPFRGSLFAMLKELGGDRKPVPSARLAAETGGSMWQIWYHMDLLRKIGMVRNVGKRGWMVNAA